MAVKMPKDKCKAKLYKQWKEYLSNTRLNDEDVARRAKSFTKKGMRPPNERSS